MAAFFVIDDPDVQMVVAMWAVAFFRIGCFGCGQAGEAAEQGVVLTNRDLR